MKAKGKEAKLAACGFVITTVEELLDLSPEEVHYIELKLQLASHADVEKITECPGGLTDEHMG